MGSRMPRRLVGVKRGFVGIFCGAKGRAHRAHRLRPCLSLGARALLSPLAEGTVVAAKGKGSLLPRESEGGARGNAQKSSALRAARSASRLFHAPFWPYGRREIHVAPVEVDLLVARVGEAD